MGQDFGDSVEGVLDKYDSFCILTCSCLRESFPEDRFNGRLIVTKQGMELLIPKGFFPEKNNAGECYVFPSKSGNNEEYLSALRDSCIKSSDVSLIVIPETGKETVDSDFVKEVEESIGLPVEIRKIGLDFFESYLSACLYEFGYRQQNTAIEKLVADKDELDRKYSDSLMAMDMLGLLVGLEDEENVIEIIIELIKTIFSPEQVIYTAVSEGIVKSVSKLNPKDATESPIDLRAGSEMPPVAEEISRSGFLLPVSVWGEIVGFLAVEGLEYQSDCESYLSTVRLFIPLCGLTIKNARNYDALEAALNDRDDEIARRRKAEEALSKAIKKLVLLSSITRHDILNQIMVANYYLEVAIEDYLELKEQLSPAVKAVDQIKRQIEFTRDYQEMGVSPPSWQNLAPLVSECFSVRDYPNEVEVVKDLPDIEIFGDPMLGKAFCNVISNAYIHAEGLTKLEISGLQSGENFIIRITDNGPGVPGDKKELIFKPGYGRVHGYGLFLVTEILGITDIRIWECGKEGEGAVFEIEVPSGSWRFTEEKE